MTGVIKFLISSHSLFFSFQMLGLWWHTPRKSINAGGSADDGGSDNDDNDDDGSWMDTCSVSAKESADKAEQQ